MHARNRRLFAMLLLLFACGPISPLGPSSSETDATLETQKAEVVFQPQSAAGETIPVGSTRVARQGDKIDVKPQGEALLRFADLLVVDIFHDSEVQLKYAGVDPSAPLLIQFLLNNGSVFNTITPQARAAQRIQFQTPGGVTITATGTEFFVNYDVRLHRTWTIVKTGSVEAAAAGVTVEAVSGQQIVVPDGVPPAAPSPATRAVLDSGFPDLGELTGGKWNDQMLLTVTAAVAPTLTPISRTTAAPTPAASAVPNLPRVTSVAWSPDGTQLATADSDGVAYVWDSVSGKRLRTLSETFGTRKAAIFNVEWSPDGKQLATASDVSRVWDVGSGKLLLTLGVTDFGKVNQITWSPKGDRLATATLDVRARVWARVWDAQTGQLLSTLTGHQILVSRVAWSPDGKRLATASLDLTARVWDADTGKPLAVLAGHLLGVRMVSWSPDGQRLLTASDDQTARVWDPNSGKNLIILPHNDRVFDAVWSPEGKRIATAAINEVRVWEPSRGEILLTLKTSGESFDVAWSPNGQRVATSRVLTAQEPQIWDANSGQVVAVLRGHQGAVNMVAWSPDGRTVATASHDGSARIWESATGKQLHLLQ